MQSSNIKEDIQYIHYTDITCCYIITPNPEIVIYLDATFTGCTEQKKNLSQGS